MLYPPERSPYVYHVDHIVKIENARENGFPLLVLGGSIETYVATRGGFQEMDAIVMLKPHTKFAFRPPSVDLLPHFIANAYRHSWYGRPGASFIDLPGDLIQGTTESFYGKKCTDPVSLPPASGPDPLRLSRVAKCIMNAKSPLVVVGKGAAYSRAEGVIRQFIDKTKIPILPSPMGKGVVADSHPLNASSMRSMAMQLADVVIIFGARLNWMFAYGLSLKWKAGV